MSVKSVYGMVTCVVDFNLRESYTENINYVIKENEKIPSLCIVLILVYLTWTIFIPVKIAPSVTYAQIRSNPSL